MQVFQTGRDRYSPAQGKVFAPVNQRSLAFFVGCVALGLPLALLFGVYNGVVPTCFRDSLSHFYYAPFWGSVFIGALIFIGTYLLVYQGEDRAGAEGRLASWAGLCAYGVGLFPTDGHGCDDGEFLARAMALFSNEGGVVEIIARLDDSTGMIDSGLYFQLTRYSQEAHYISAALLFFFLAWFAFFVFTAVEDHQRNPDGSLTREKRARNGIYHLCGWIMVAAIAGMAVFGMQRFLGWGDLQYWSDRNLIFWLESLALWAFGLSWMVKGRFLNSALRDRAER